MRLLRLRIVNQKMLRDISLDFTQRKGQDVSGETSYAIDLLVGVNGTGKSTLLRSLAIIFQYLAAGRVVPFGFAIEYLLQNNREPIFLSNLVQEEVGQTPSPSSQELLEGARLRYRGSATKIAGEQIISIMQIPADDLPPVIIALTSGSEHDWLNHEAHSDVDNEINRTELTSPTQNVSNFKEELEKWYRGETHPTESKEKTQEVWQQGTEESRFYLITTDLVPLVVLCGLLNAFAEGLQIAEWIRQALHEAKIKALRGFSLEFRMSALRADQRDVIQMLGKQASQVIRTGLDYLLVFMFEQDSVTERENTVKQKSVEHGLQLIKPEYLLHNYWNGLGLFKKLLPFTQHVGESGSVLRKVNLFLESGREAGNIGSRTQKPSLYLFDWLSDGEQSFLSRLCLLPLLSENEALVLLDEPEVHFNDYWKRQLVLMISSALQKQHTHVLMSTHSSITLSDVTNTNIWLLMRDRDDQSRALQPNLRTLGADPSDILVHVFGAESAIGAYSHEYILKQIAEATRVYRNDPQQRLSHLHALLDQVGPGYLRFLIRREILSLEAPQL